MAKISRNTQDNTEQFKGALDSLYWQKFFHLEQHERPDAIQAMVNRGILTPEKNGHYEVKLNIRSINSSARNFEYGPNKTPLYFRKEDAANTLVEFCRDKGGSTIKKHSIKQID